MVPPVARMTICGRCVSLNAKVLIVSNAIASNALNFILTYPKKIKVKFARYYCKRLIAKGLPGVIFFLSADMFNFDARKGILIILRTTLVQR
jgi:hypothetical protein